MCEHLAGKEDSFGTQESECLFCWNIGMCREVHRVILYAVLDVTAAFKDKTKREGLLVRSKDLSLRRINRNELQPFW
jgi:hypothetical protein